MREIKFRAWCEYSEEMCMNISVVDGRAVKDGYQWFNTENTVLRSVLMQYTGLKDCRGVESYEGDIVAWRGGAPHFLSVIAWSDEDAAFICEGIGRTSGASLNPQYIAHYEIIGNIYENPELLEPQK